MSVFPSAGHLGSWPEAAPATTNPPANAGPDAPARGASGALVQSRVKFEERMGKIRTNVSGASQKVASLRAFALLAALTLVLAGCGGSSKPAGGSAGGGSTISPDALGRSIAQEEQTLLNNHPGGLGLQAAVGNQEDNPGLKEAVVTGYSCAPITLQNTVAGPAADQTNCELGICYPHLTSSETTELSDQWSCNSTANPPIVGRATVQGNLWAINFSNDTNASSHLAVPYTNQFSGGVGQAPQLHPPGADPPPPVP